MLDPRVRFELHIVKHGCYSNNKDKFFQCEIMRLLHRRANNYVKHESIEFQPYIDKDTGEYMGFRYL